MKLSVYAFGLSGGLIWGVCVFAWTLILSLTSLDMGADMLNLFVGIYPYYEITATGAFVGLIAGFIDGFVGCALFAWLYNVLAKKLNA